MTTMKLTFEQLFDLRDAIKTLKDSIKSLEKRAGKDIDTVEAKKEIASASKVLRETKASTKAERDAIDNLVKAVRKETRIEKGPERASAKLKDAQKELGDLETQYAQGKKAFVESEQDDSQ